jgi:hypothetical protein
MSFTPKELSGSLWKNEDKTAERHPNAKGSALIDGVEYWVSAWTKETQDGKKW